MTVHAMECAHRSHVGLVRKQNEDYLACFDRLGLLVLGDGMGGHTAGEVASRLAVETAAEALMPVQQEDRADDLESLMYVGRAVEQANRAVIDAVVGRPELEGMGTTLVLAMFRQQRLFYSYVGDSRLYRLRDRQLRQLTRDHSLVQELIDHGLFASLQEARKAGIGENILTRSIGLNPDVEVDVGDHELFEDDLYLLCSDGLCGKVEDHQIESIMLGSNDVEQIADQLQQAALDIGGRDNISLIVARME